ncbi:unnamed protein product [Rotaria sp. Silwood1]|nr:unnamed protein product [Rotaria sp. Silwood1]CAF3830461.1 unnamed protein product [Rotaria sp. Silwood1]CAF3927510.1 unnamed protein product [Rotaria sp. Silwood1]CAF4723026.1 unnamed protein product [Rotaria sp. Silwood1]CAF4764736.1 unnamed protein product [Rotaria sp. Silwood1]
MSFPLDWTQETVEKVDNYYRSKYPIGENETTDQEQLMIEAIENQLKQFKIRFVPNNEADEINSSVEP